MLPIDQIISTNRGVLSNKFLGTALHESLLLDFKQQNTIVGVDFKKIIGGRIQKAREARNWSQAELAKETNDVLGATRIGNYETGFRMPGPREIVILGKVLGVKPAYLMGLDDSELQLTPKEEELIKNLRTFTEKRREEVFIAIQAESLQTRAPARPVELTKTRAKIK